MGRFWPLDQAGQHPANIVANVEQKEASDGDEVGGAPGGTFSCCALDEHSDCRENSQGDEEAGEDGQNPDPDPPDDAKSTCLLEHGSLIVSSIGLDQLVLLLQRLFYFSFCLSLGSIVLKIIGEN